MANQSNNHDQGWTQYQKLVLAELERHDTRQIATDKEVVELKLQHAKLTLEVSTIKEKVIEMTSDNKDDTIDLRRARDEIMSQKLDINSLKIRLGMWCAAISVIGSGAVGAIFKFFLHG